MDVEVGVRSIEEVLGGCSRHDCFVFVICERDMEVQAVNELRSAFAQGPRHPTSSGSVPCQGPL